MTYSTPNYTVVVLGVIATLFVFVALNASLWPRRANDGRGATTMTNWSLDDDDRQAMEEGQEFVALDMDEAKELYGGNRFTTLKGEFAWNQFQVGGYVEHQVLDDRDDENSGDGDFVIVEKHDAERRLAAKASSSAEQIQHGRPNYLRKLKTYYKDGELVGTSDGDYEGIYVAGDIQDYQLNTISKLLHDHEYVAFTKRWRSADHLILTQMCTIKHSSEPGAYYCVEGRTVCVTVKSMYRFYGKHTGGGACGTLPLDDETLESLPETFQEAYATTCDGDRCDGSHRAALAANDS